LVLDHADTADWLEGALAGGASDVATVVYHSIVSKQEPAACAAGPAAGL